MAAFSGAVSVSAWAFLAATDELLILPSSSPLLANVAVLSSRTKQEPVVIPRIVASVDETISELHERIEILGHLRKHLENTLCPVLTD